MTREVESKKSVFSPIIIIGILFFVFGFITWLNSALIPFLQRACELNNFESYFVTFAFYIAYFVFAFPSSWVISKIGYKKSMALGLLTMALGAVIFVPAALFRVFWVFLLGLFLLGSGLTLLQTASNPYVAALGPMESAAKRISIMGVCNKIAGMLAPIVLSVFTMGGEELSLNQISAKCIPPYIGIAISLAILAVWVKFSSLPEITGEMAESESAAATEVTATDSEDAKAKVKTTTTAEVAQTEAVKNDAITRTKNVEKMPLKPILWGFVAIFFYVGAEVISIDTLINYANYCGIDQSLSRIFPSISMLMLLIGYFIGIWGIPKHFSQKQALLFSCLGACILSLFAIFFGFGESGFDGTQNSSSVFCLSALGIFNAMMWPAIWGLCLREYQDKHMNICSSILIMGIIGGALLPLVFGAVADRFSYVFAYFILPICYILIGVYAMLQKK